MWSRTLSRYRLFAVLLSLLMIAALLPVPQVSARQAPALVTCPSDDVHTEPNILAPVLATYYNGQTVTLAAAYDSATTWTLVRTHQGQLGWMKTVCVRPTTDSPPATPTGITARIATGKLNVRTGPGVQHPVIEAFFSGTVLPVVGRAAGSTWVQVVLPSGAVGWLNSAYTRLSVPLSSVPVVGAPPGTPAPSPAPPPVTFIRHVVQRGETLAIIGARYGVTWQRLAAFNNIANANLIYAGQTLLIPR